MRSLKQEVEKGKVMTATGATEMLRQDHRRVKELFDEFEHAEDRGAKRKLVEKALIELSIHAKIEEELFYPMVRRETEEEELLDLAEEEHHVAKLLIGEISRMKVSDPRYDAKFMVLAGGVRRHIEEEEGEIFPKIEQASFDLESLGQELSERKMLLFDHVDLAMIRGEAGREIPLPPGGRRSRRSSRGMKSRRVSSRPQRRSRA